MEFYLLVLDSGQNMYFKTYLHTYFSLTYRHLEIHL